MFKSCLNYGYLFYFFYAIEIGYIIKQKSNQMSFLLEAFDVLIQNQTLATAAFQRPCYQNKQSRSFQDNQKIIVLRKTLQNRNQQLIQFWSNGQRVELFFLLNKLHRNLSYILKATINMKNYELKFEFKLLNFSLSNYMKVSSAQRRIFAQKSIYILNKLQPNLFNQLKISVQASTGIIKLVTPIYYNNVRDIFQIPKKVQLFINMFQNNTPKLYQSLLDLIQITNQSPHKYAQDSYFKTKHKLKLIQKYSKILNLVVNIGAEQTSEYQHFTIQSFNQQQSLSQINKNIIKDMHQLDSKCIYLSRKEEMYDSIDNQAKEEDLSLHESERQIIIKNLQITRISDMRKSNQRKFVVNHIKLFKPLKQLQLCKLNYGGFSKIYQAEVLFKPEENSIEYGKMQREEELRKRVMVIKQANPGFASKIKHEKEILLKMKVALAVFLPKYYFPVNQQTQENILLVEKIRNQFSTTNLQEFAQICQNTMSIHTKICIGFLILQGLRFLKDCKIVHLDLKPSNIMIGKKLDLKFIDFDSSYHPTLKQHFPSHTMPYSSPQNYYKTSDFTFKSDVFSFGVIMLKLLASKHPFYVFSEKQRGKAFLTISERWFFVAQALSQYGQTHVFPYILLAISKCLNDDPKCRPQLQWMNLIFRQYMHFY